MILQFYKKILVFAAHPDDEVIGCGGTIRKFSTMGSKILVVIVTDGRTGITKNNINPRNIINERKKESQLSSKILGIHKLEFLKNKTQEIQNNKVNFHKFIEIIRNFKPDLILTHSNHDKHRDHKVVFELTNEAVWKAKENIMPELGDQHNTSELWSFEILDPFSAPDIIVDISDVFENKIKAIDLHKSQLPILDNIKDYLKGISLVRGYQTGIKHGEAFKVLNSCPRVF